MENVYVDYDISSHDCSNWTIISNIRSDLYNNSHNWISAFIIFYDCPFCFPFVVRELGRGYLFEKLIFSQKDKILGGNSRYFFVWDSSSSQKSSKARQIAFTTW